MMQRFLIFTLKCKIITCILYPLKEGNWVIRMSENLFQPRQYLSVLCLLEIGGSGGWVYPVDNINLWHSVIIPHRLCCVLCILILYSNPRYIKQSFVYINNLLYILYTCKCISFWIQYVVLHSAKVLGLKEAMLFCCFCFFLYVLM